MISDKMRNRVATLRELASVGRLTKDMFNLAMEGFLCDADLIGQIENRPVPAARRPAGDGVVDFTKAKSRRDAEAWLRAQGLKVPPDGPGGEA